MGKSSKYGIQFLLGLAVVFLMHFDKLLVIFIISLFFVRMAHNRGRQVYMPILIGITVLSILLIPISRYKYGTDGWGFSWTVNFLGSYPELIIWPACHFVTPRNHRNNSFLQLEDEELPPPIYAVTFFRGWDKYQSTNSYNYYKKMRSNLYRYAKRNGLVVPNIPTNESYAWDDEKAFNGRGDWFFKEDLAFHQESIEQGRGFTFNDSDNHSEFVGREALYLEQKRMYDLAKSDYDRERKIQEQRDYMYRGGADVLRRMQQDSDFRRKQKSILRELEALPKHSVSYYETKNGENGRKSVEANRVYYTIGRDSYRKEMIATDKSIEESYEANPDEILINSMDSARKYSGYAFVYLLWHQWLFGYMALQNWSVILIGLSFQLWFCFLQGELDSKTSSIFFTW